MIGKHAKTIVALVTGCIGWASTVAATSGGFHHVTAPEWIGLATVIAVAFGVYSAPNIPSAPSVSTPHPAPLLPQVPPLESEHTGSSSFDILPAKRTTKRR